MNHVPVNVSVYKIIWNWEKSDGWSEELEEKKSPPLNFYHEMFLDGKQKKKKNQEWLLTTQRCEVMFAHIQHEKSSNRNERMKGKKAHTYTNTEERNG